MYYGNVDGVQQQGWYLRIVQNVKGRDMSGVNVEYVEAEEKSHPSARYVQETQRRWLSILGEYAINSHSVQNVVSISPMI